MEFFPKPIVAVSKKKGQNKFVILPAIAVLKLN
jgi:hypothetical protein